MKSRAGEVSLSHAAETHSPEPAEALRHAFHRAEAAALDSLAVAFFNDVLRFASAMLGNEEDALDATQETFLRMFELHRAYDPARPLRPWLFGIGRRCCLEYQRRAARSAARIVDIAEVEETERLISELPSAYEVLMREELGRNATELLAHLDEATRAIILLHIVEDLTFREIAGVVGRPAATVATIYYRTMKVLRQRFGPLHGESRGRTAGDAS